jgi:hypothetical protein
LLSTDHGTIYCSVFCGGHSGFHISRITDIPNMPFEDSSRHRSEPPTDIGSFNRVFGVTFSDGSRARRLAISKEITSSMAIAFLDYVVVTRFVMNTSNGTRYMLSSL